VDATVAPSPSPPSLSLSFCCSHLHRFVAAIVVHHCHHRLFIVTVSILVASSDFRCMFSLTGKRNGKSEFPPEFSEFRFFGIPVANLGYRKTEHFFWKNRKKIRKFILSVHMYMLLSSIFLQEFLRSGKFHTDSCHFISQAGKIPAILCNTLHGTQQKQ